MPKIHHQHKSQNGNYCHYKSNMLNLLVGVIDKLGNNLQGSANPKFNSLKKFALTFYKNMISLLFLPATQPQLIYVDDSISVPIVYLVISDLKLFSNQFNGDEATHIFCLIILGEMNFSLIHYISVVKIRARKFYETFPG